MELLKKLAKVKNIKLTERLNGHYTLHGPLIVHYYPYSKNKVAYVNGTVKGIKNVTPEKAITMCFKAPEISEIKNKRFSSSKINRKHRQYLINKGNTNCMWCNKPLTINTSTLEHIIPLDRGGLNNPCNFGLACEFCNTKRDNDMPELKEENFWSKQL